MKQFLTLIMLVIFANTTIAQNNDYSNLWKKVEKYEAEGRPKSALEIVETILKKSKKDNIDSQIVKSMLYKSKFGLTLEEDAQLKIINDFKTEIFASKFPTTNILESLLANMYWQYFKENRYRFYNRTKTAEKVDKVDFRTWDLQTLFNEINLHFKNSLKSGLMLQQEDLKRYDALLQLAPDSKIYRPTLFDFLAHTALEFYKTNETSISKPAYKFELDNPELLGDANSFVQLNITSQDSTSLQLNALNLYQDLMHFHLKDSNPKALVDVDLERLNFVKNNTSISNKEGFILETLKKTKDKYQNHEVSGRYASQIAIIYFDLSQNYTPKITEEHRWKAKEALEICESVISKFPKSKGAIICKNLKQNILREILSIKTEGYIPNQSVSKVLVSYSNIPNLTFKVLSISEKQLLKLNTSYKKHEQLAVINKLKEIASWNQGLKNEKDYQLHSIEIKIPELDNGRYLLYAEYENKRKTFAFSTIQATDFALVQKNINDKVIYQIINRNNGRPISNATVNIKYQKNYRNQINTITKITDATGEVLIEKGNKRWTNINIEVTKNNEQGVFGNYYINGYYGNRNQEEQVKYNGFLFMDRSIYRPGQTLYFKGILIKRKDQKTSTLINEPTTAILYNANNEEVGRESFATNEFGSFAGQFIIPNSGLTGQFRLTFNGEEKASKLNVYNYFSVEEYKRPKFEANFNPVKETYKIDDSVSIKGKALAYAGSSISDAKVVYRVIRNVNYPRWFYWYRPYFNSSPQEIAHGETTTDAEGNFKITFKALADKTSKKENLPIFRYSVTADITDINGETRSTSTIVNVGFHALTADINISNKIDKTKKNNSITIDTKNLNGEFVPASGRLRIYKLNAPKNVLRPRPWNAPDYNIYSKEEFKNLFPHEAFNDEDKNTNWKKGELILDKKFDTKKSTSIDLKNIKKWKSGAYVIELESQDKFGQKIKDIAHTNVFSNKDERPSDQQLFSIVKDKSIYKVDEKVKVTLGSSAKDITVFVDIEKEHTIVKSYKISLKNSFKTLEIPVNKSDLGGFTIHYSYAIYNHFKNGRINISVPYPKTDLEIETSTFRDKLQPGTEETWSFKIKGPKGDKVSAELLASMYDMSLDQFKPHQWKFKPINLPSYYSRFRIDGKKSFKTTNFRVHNSYTIDYNTINQTYDRFNWFGLNLGRNNMMLIRGSSSIYGNRTVAAIEVDEMALEEVVVQDTEVTNELQGKVAGVQITGASGNSDSFLKVRGANTDTSNPPLYVVDGKVKDNITDIDQSDIESINILKAEEAVAIYGEKGANGVVIITTKNSNPFKQVKVRTNLQETAFFNPDLRTDKDGNVSFSFTTPEALTQWKLQLVAHTKTLESATKTLQTVTQKELMVIPNAPRFLREGDQITISSKIANLADKALSGSAILQLYNGLDNSAIDTELGNAINNKAFKVDAKGNTNVSWNLAIPEGIQAVQYKVIAKTKEFSDGEQNVLPVLSNRMLVTETMPMWIRSNQTKTFTLDKLKNVSSTSLRQHNLTLEMTSNPAWYAVQVLPYLMEYPYECNEQTFSRYYANVLASHIANSNPRIQEVFKQWKDSDALLSNLEKNQELKSLLIQETPWVRDAQSETEQKKRIALLFDLNKMNSELQSSILKLKKNQLDNGSWPWFDGGRPNRFITQHIITGFGHLKHLKVKPSKDVMSMIENALSYLDSEFIKEYKDLTKYREDVDLSKDHLSHTQLHYMYMRSFYPEVKKSRKVEEIMDYYHTQIKKYWLSRSLYSKGLMALVSFRNEDVSTSNKIITSLKENSITSEELGMYWKVNTNSWFWHQAPIETQALLIEAFSEIENETETIDNLKIWLLKNKQTNRWKTTKATTEAVYALLLQGSDWLSVTDMVKVKVGGKAIEPSKLENVKVEAGTGYYKTSWKTDEIKSEMADVTIAKKGKGIAWGGLYWQYFEDLDKITSAETPLQLKKKLFIKTNTDIGEELSEITKDTKLKLGDLVRVRIELRTDRTMEFVHMKDMRAAGFEPVNVMSRYKYQDGLGYYESTKDAATNFFMDYLPKGIYVFEYDLRVNNAGNMSNGITTIQSMYAPEFSSHSEGIRVNVE